MVLLGEALMAPGLAPGTGGTGWELWPSKLEGPRYADEGRANGSSLYGYAKVAADDRLSELERTDARRRSPEGVGANGVLGAGRVKVNVWMVEAGCSVDAITSTSRVKESYWLRRGDLSQSAHTTNG